MSSQVSAPVSTTVLAVDIFASTRDSARRFQHLIDAAREIGYVTTDADSAVLVLTLAPECPLGETLSRVAAAAAQFDASARPACSRGVVHFGTVFRTEADGHFSFMGSAIRSTQSILRRAPASAGWFATRDFVEHANVVGGMPFSLKSLNGATIDGLSSLSFGAVAAITTPATSVDGADPAVVGYLKKRLAQDVGPFAGPLVDRALNTSTALDVLIPALGSHIDEPDRRAHFEAEVREHLKASHGG